MQDVRAFGVIALSVTAGTICFFSVMILKAIFFVFSVNTSDGTIFYFY